MVNPANREAINTLAADLFSRDHPERAWCAIEDNRHRLGVASAQEQAVYRGFARARLASEARVLDPAVAAVALSSDAGAKGKLGAA